MRSIACGAYVQAVSVHKFSYFTVVCISVGKRAPVFRLISELTCFSVSHRVTKHMTAEDSGGLLWIKKLVFCLEFRTFPVFISPFPINMYLTNQVHTSVCVCVCINKTSPLRWMNTPVCLSPGVPCRWWCTAALLQLVATGPYFIRCNNHSYAQQVCLSHNSRLLSRLQAIW